MKRKSTGPFKIEAAALARLPDKQRETFSMLKLEGLSIARARAGVSVGAFRVRAHRAYKALGR